MSVKIVKRSPVAMNLIIFIALSLVFFHIMHSLHRQTSTLDVEFLLKNLKDFKFLIGLNLISILSVWKGLRVSKLIVLVFFGVTLFETFSFFIVDFDKSLLILNFIYLIFCFNFWISWGLELEEAHYFPAFNLRDLNLHATYKIDVKVGSKNRVYEGQLTNWGKSSCFVLLNERWDEIKEPVELMISFEGNQFHSKAEVVSRYGAGLGLRLLSQEEENGLLGWPDFYGIVDDRGYDNIT